MNNRNEKFHRSFFKHVKRIAGRGIYPIQGPEIRAARYREQMRRRTTGGGQPPAATAGNISPGERRRTTGGGEPPAQGPAFTIPTTTTTTTSDEMPLIIFSPYVGTAALNEPDVSLSPQRRHSVHRLKARKRSERKKAEPKVR
jgi:hypothetical protein